MMDTAILDLITEAELDQLTISFLDEISNDTIDIPAGSSVTTEDIAYDHCVSKFDLVNDLTHYYILDSKDLNDRQYLLSVSIIENKFDSKRLQSFYIED